MSDDEQRRRGADSVHRVGGLLGDLQAADDQPVSPRRRADAERNRAQILAAAERLFADGEDPRAVTMDKIAKAAGVGRATLYRSFPDPPSVAVALLDEHERRLQGQLIYGPPPLGPGAPAGERLAAFYLAMLDLLERHLPLALGAETGPARFRTGAYGFWRVHVRTLLVDHGVRDPDPLIDIALSPLAPELFHFQRRELGLSAERVGRSLTGFARQLLASGE
ncbi:MULTISPECIES: TetR/AcrR family transcriptional regulator [unclassified Streptomyces]|uniref:TetR/AcrR family transcriptional regulator n=1 Tax=unclassified Streptomyces TaxID=2593676 RepID=UPI0016603E59|nr:MULTISPECIES: TetR/AcrR family transcriptional regulator [unclassified Streptomyces]MBD0712166.1 TetR family transcriptional regulator [Streptomyces sp. CBMA291]MBD0713998.1 TetR family transcriptional regulator [Streptomyces sp. CBMA370]